MHAHPVARKSLLRIGLGPRLDPPALEAELRRSLRNELARDPVLAGCEWLIQRRLDHPPTADPPAVRLLIGGSEGPLGYRKLALARERLSRAYADPVDDAERVEALLDLFLVPGS